MSRSQTLSIYLFLMACVPSFTVSTNLESPSFCRLYIAYTYMCIFYDVVHGSGYLWAHMQRHPITICRVIGQYPIPEQSLAFATHIS